ncbi:MAG: hypothetical protein ABH886_07475, partial [Candidatus Desantisbacteria bacterium]
MAGKALRQSQWEIWANLECRKQIHLHSLFKVLCCFRRNHNFLPFYLAIVYNQNGVKNLSNWRNIMGEKKRENFTAQE